MAQDMPLGLHGKISRERAEALLKPWQDGFYLIRESTHYPGDFTLCVCISGRVEHYHIITTQNHNSSGRNSLTIDEEVFFLNLQELIQHYTEDADGLVCNLKKPVERKLDNIMDGHHHSQRGPQHTADGSFKKDGDKNEMKNLMSGPWAVNKNELKLGEEIGHGFFGAVKVGEYQNKKVAVKVISGDNEAAQSIVAEASIMTQLRHPNLVALIGVIPDQPNSISIVLEFMAKGNLLDYVRSRGRTVITRKLQLKFSIDIGAGMCYLEQKLFVHRDLAARNILISEDDVAKVSDFGLAQDNSTQLGTGGKIPVKWTAPEAYKKKLFTTKSDVWSFGILLWELFSFGRVPYPRVPADDVMTFLTEGSRMQAPGDNCKDVHELMMKCWQTEPEKRPTFSQLQVRLKELPATAKNDS
ncbi:tyrosine-protein kinase CSK [Strongylocentrotus purpuratus]|uniref:Tyrosine-protein kinase n=1 Tax=Strongylocentrotus purpuratus TaxID=7668 RepID=A0A7M7N804_STRPU|nr:tyrosine-protein kinase CSK [Strongylocentrotus purpuratus]XP_030832505.1 tyrosine-protein kinase CSK [Strongylocentrotus purpuratus]|eukprot:XP_780437.3 PREDICTED: tyrosine-protein kinase CSK [Strongylocentrotus purpuratus]